MTATPLLIPPVRLSGRRAGAVPVTDQPTRASAPVIRLVPPCSRSRALGLATVDDRGRLADQTVIEALGWTPGTRLAVHVCAGLLIAAPGASGRAGVTPRGHLHLPADVRQRVRIFARDRVLLVAEPDANRLVIYPPAALHAMVNGFQAFRLGGEDA